MLENGVFNRPYVRDITKICECACSMNCDKNATELRPDRNPDIITNADRIRAMSDEELAEWLCRALDCGFCKSYLQDMSIYSCCENQVKGIFDWLQSPTEEDA